ncbi:MAG: NAD(P)/FAD-dependent oxidoreductase [Candidatus Diapherotrites archaeon]|nr:NAD(P)/FAD-dependent oxidoreductase [Candidatus Diapherotrites archaeon]
MEKNYDVAIIGAGPAGGMAALSSARNGLNTLLLEEHATIGEPVHCGECISDLALKKFDLKVPKKTISLEVKGVRVVFPDHTAPTLKEDGYVLEKHLWEQWLAEEAVKQGAELKLNSRVTDIKRNAGKWEVGSGENVFQCKVLIDASGVQSIASLKLGLNQKRFESVIGIQYEMLEVKNEGWLDFYLWPKLAPAGYLWLIPKNNSRANVGLVTSQKNKAKAFLDEFIKEPDFAGKKIVKTFGGLIPASGPLEKTFDAGLMLVGDAAGFTSPMFEGGSHLGLKSGELAANIAAKAVQKNDFSKETIREYEMLWKKEFPPYEELFEGKHGFYTFSEQEMNQIARALPKELNNVNAFDKLMVGLKILATNPKLVRKELFGAFKAFAYSQAKYYGW